MKKPAKVIEELYVVEINKVICRRLRVVAIILIIMLLGFNCFDWIFYPELAENFLKLRVIVSSLICIIFFLTFSKRLRKNVIWLATAAAVSHGMAISLIINLADSSQSSYYEFINLSIMAPLVCNGFFLIPNLVAAGLQILFYNIAVLLKLELWDTNNFLFANYFMTGTSIMMLLLTKIFSTQYKNTFLSTEELNQSEKALEKSNNRLIESNKELDKLYQKARDMAMKDLLTGLYNQTNFKETLKKEFDFSKRYRAPLSIIFIDLDNFKDINDTYGHQIGDLILKKVSEVILKGTRGSDFSARYGGDEIAVILPNTNRDMAFFLAERIRRKLDNISLKDKKGPDKIGASIGLAELSRDDVSPEAFLERVDHAVYLAKDSGRGQINVWDKIEKQHKDKSEEGWEKGTDEMLSALEAVVDASNESINRSSDKHHEIIILLSKKLNFSPKQT
ncbi:MAG: GGDEF domain-containing protein [bacterium]